MNDKKPTGANLQALDGLLCKFEKLIEELDTFKAELGRVNRTHTVRFGTFDSTVKSDLIHLRKLKESGESSSANLQSLCSSNIPFYEATWNIAKRTSGLIAFKKKVFWRSPPLNRDAKASDVAYYGRDHGVQVDIITQNGTQWIKVSSLTARRLMHDIAKEGWGESDTESDADDESDARPYSDGPDYDSGIPIIKLAQDLKKACRANRVRYRDPAVKIVLPRMVEDSPLIKKALDKIRALGVELELGLPARVPTVEEALPDLMAFNENYSELTETLNIDTTVLLALVSDISHAKAEPGDLKHTQKREQAQSEMKDQLLHGILYPATAHRRLTCTKEAVAQMRSIVAPIGNDNEKKRTTLLFTEDSNITEAQRSSLRAQFAALSNHTVPDSFQIPICVVDKEVDSRQSPAPGFCQLVADRVGPRFAEHNASVFLHGWRAGRTTLTSNWTTVKLIEDAIELMRLRALEGGEIPKDEYVGGPAVWFIPLSRSLAGMDKGGVYYGQSRLETYKEQAAGSKEKFREIRRRTPLAASKGRRLEDAEFRDRSTAGSDATDHGDHDSLYLPPRSNGEPATAVERDMHRLQLSPS